MAWKELWGMAWKEQYGRNWKVWMKWKEWKEWMEFRAKIQLFSDTAKFGGCDKEMFELCFQIESS